MQCGPYRRAAVAVAFALLMSACGRGEDPPAAATTSAGAAPAAAPAEAPALAPAEFANRMKATKGMVVNVHVPDEGEIPGTDAHINYVGIADSEKLPADKSTELLLYCRSGRMSAEAAADLTRAGWTNVAELAGGFEAWKKEGREFTPAPA